MGEPGGSETPNKRVKVYVLDQENGQWEDRGTGYILANEFLDGVSILRSAGLILCGNSFLSSCCAIESAGAGWSRFSCRF